MGTPRRGHRASLEQPLPICKMRRIDLILYSDLKLNLPFYLNAIRKLGPTGGAESLSKRKERALNDDEADRGSDPLQLCGPRQVVGTWL